MSETTKKVLSDKIRGFKEQAVKLSNEINELDRLLNMKRSDFLRLDGAIQGLQAALNDLNKQEMDEEEEEVDKEVF